MGKFSYAAEKMSITFYGGSIGSVPYVLCGATAEVMKKAFPGAFVNVEPGGAATNAAATNRGDCEIGITMVNAVYDAWHANPPFKEPHRNLRMLCALGPYRFQMFATRKSGIERFEDILKGKVYSPAMPGQSSYNINQSVLEIYGITFDDIKKAGGDVRPMAWSELIVNMGDGHVDISSWTTALPNPGIMQILKSTDGYLLGLSDDKIEKFLQKHPQFSKAVIPAGSYEGQDKDINTFGTALAFVTHKDMPEEVVYKITKAFWENRDYLVRSYGGLRWVQKDTVIKDLKIPVHPGALKFYKEIGVPEAQ